MGAVYWKDRYVSSGVFLLTAFVTSSFGGDDFFIDVAQFFGGAGQTVVEVYVGVPLDGFTPVKSGSNDIYSFTVGAQLETPDGAEVIARDVKAKTAIIPESDTREEPLSVGQVTMVVPPGDYKLTCGVGDVNAGTSNLKEVTVTVVDFSAAAPRFSDIEIASSIASADETLGDEFVKGRLHVIPNPTKLVNDRQAELLIYYELYGLRGTDEAPVRYNLHYAIQLVNGKVFLRNKEVFDAYSDAISKVGSFDLEGFPIGPYEVVVGVTDENDKAVLSDVRKEFVYYHETTPGELAEIRSKYLPYTEAEAEKIRREISYFAMKSELEAFDAMSGEDKPIFVELIWKRRDPTPQTDDNEFEDAFYERFEYAEVHYSTPFRSGADSDMGYIYIKFGPPEDITQEPAGLPSEVDYESSTWQGEPFEVWEYNYEGRRIWFLFIDYDGDGDYYLDSSNEPGYGIYVSPGSPNR